MSGLVGSVDGAVQAWKANRKQSNLRAVGGTLSLLPDCLVFKPHVVDAALAGQTWQVYLSQVRSVGREGTNLGDLLAGGLTNRLRIDMWDGSVELFNVWGLDEIVNYLGTYLAWFQQQAGLAAPVSAAVCAGCGSPLAPTNKFCGQCGRPVGR